MLRVVRRFGISLDISREAHGFPNAALRPSEVSFAIHFFLELFNFLCDNYRQIGRLGPIHPLTGQLNPVPKYVQQTSNILKSSLRRRIAVMTIGISGLKIASFVMSDTGVGIQG